LVRGGTRCPAFAVQMGSLEVCEGKPRPFQEGSHNSLDSLAHRWRRGGFVAQVQEALNLLLNHLQRIPCVG
jgi:hypothetical protein